MRFSDFSDGLWVVEGRDFALPPNALLVADNIEYNVSGSVQGRRGRTKLNSVSLGGATRSMWRHYPRTGTPSTLAAYDAGSTTAFKNASGSSGTFSAVTGGAGFADAVPWYFTNWPARNKSFLANGVDPLQSYDGTTIAAVTSAGGVGNLNPVPNGPYIVVHKSRLWSTTSTELNFSVYASEINDETIFPAANQISVNDPRGGLVTGLESFFDNLVVLKQNSLWRFIGDIGTLTGAQLARYSDKGCVAPNTAVTTPFGIIFLDKDGLFLTDGIQPNPDELSAPIRPLFVSRSGENQYPNAVGTWYPRKNQYVLKLDPNATDAYVLTRLQVLSYNAYIGQNSRAVWLWSHQTSLPCADGTNMSAWSSAVDDNRLIVGDADGFIWTVDADNIATDDGVPYQCKVQVVARPIDATQRTGRVYRVKTFYRGQRALSGALRYNAHQSDDVTFTVGSNTGSPTEREIRTGIFDFNNLGRLVSVSLANDTDGYNFELHLIDLDIRLRSPRVWVDS